MVRLVPMSEEEYLEAVRRAIPRHAARSVERGEWTAEGSLEASAEEYRTNHPQGRQTPFRHFAHVVDDATGTRVGEVWYSSQLLGGKVRFWVDWLWIDPEHRRHGFAAQTLQHLSEQAVGEGAERIGLYVYLDNPAAVALYTKLGFVAKNMSMVRELRPSPRTQNGSTAAPTGR